MITHKVKLFNIYICSVARYIFLILHITVIDFTEYMNENMNKLKKNKLFLITDVNDFYYTALYCLPKTSNIMIDSK